MSLSECFHIREGIERGPAWFIATLLVVILLLAWVRVRYSRFFGLALKSFTVNRFAGQLIREERVFTHGGALLLSLVALLSIGLFAYQLTYLQPFSWINPTGFVLFLIIAVGLFAFAIVKLILYNIFGFILNMKNNTVVYIFNITLFNWVLSILLLPIAILVEFLTIAPPLYFIITGITLVIIFYIGCISKILYLGFTTTSYSLFYIIFYLCTLEILPLIIILKLLLGKVPQA